jgi:ABC-2 type transport system permease protein
MTTSLPIPMSASRVLRAYLVEAKYEILQKLRMPAFVIPLLLLPPGIYLLVLVLTSHDIHAHPAVANFMFAGFAIFALAGPALFGVGCTLAVERDAGLMTLKRALPAPRGAYLISKTVMAVAFAALAMGAVLVAALLVGKISFTAVQLLAFSAVALTGMVPLCALGLWIGVHASGAAAPGLTQIIYLPMLYLSGLFFPLPKVLQPWAVIWPAFHLEQLALRASGLAQQSLSSPGMSVAILGAITLLFGGLAMRRLARAG